MSTQFEKDAIGSFALSLYHGGHISSQGMISKQIVRDEFKKYIKDNEYEKYFANSNIGTLFRVSKLLINTPRKSKIYCLSIAKIMEFQMLKEKILQRDYTGSFLLALLHQGKLQKDGIIQKSIVRSEFQEYLKKTAPKYENIFRDAVIGTLLRNSNFLFNTSKTCGEYGIIMRTVFEYRNEKLKRLDEAQIRNIPEANFSFPGSIDNNDNLLEVDIEVSPDAKKFPVVYQGHFVQQVLPNFTLTSLGCYICQENFKMQSAFEDHISTHGIEKDFQFLSSSQKTKSNDFKIFYRLCNESHFFHFTMKTTKKDLVVEKIIVVQTRLMHFVKNNKVPYDIPSDGIDSFFIDSHLFTIGVEQPIVLVYRNKFDKTIRFVEEHHFLRTEEFPQVHFTIKACRLPHNQLMKTKLRLPEYYPSLQIKTAQQDNFSNSSLCDISEDIRKYIVESKILNTKNICNVFKTLLQIEDLEAMRNYTYFSQKRAQIKRFGREYSVRLRKLPKHTHLKNIVTPLDEIILTLSDVNEESSLTRVENQYRRGKGPKIKKYVAVVENVYDNLICFKYDKSIICEKKKYDITLRPSRLLLKYQYRALEMLSRNEAMKQYLFPPLFNLWKNVSTLDLELFNPLIGNNPEQLQAVRNIAEGPNLMAPYIIFGPPGTGKTSTIVESVLQLWKRRPDTRILITAGSNSACDEVAVRLCRVLIDLQPEKPNIVRIFAKSNEKRLDSIEDILIEASNFYRGHFYPAVEVIRNYRIIVCTLSIVGKLVSAGIGSNFFTHIFIDECAASTEPEALVGCMGTYSSKTRLIISGDYKQLGPILRSVRASELGLSVSFMERLINQRCYAVDENGDYDRSIQTRLIQNHRSHPEIVRLYSSLYYNNELKPMGSKGDTRWALRWHLLPNRNRPIIFHAAYGNCRHENHELSFCNDKEINVVMDYVKDIMYFGINGRKIKETDIGIISPYKKQYIRIQEELNQRRWHDIEVGSVEIFQGKEKPIIIISTVRSFTKTLGFLANPRRLNVILSRATSLLIIIGNPKTLSQNNDFKYIIDDCIRNECVRGVLVGYNKKTEIDEKNLNNKFKNVSLNSTLKKPIEVKAANTNKLHLNTEKKIEDKCEIVVHGNTLSMHDSILSGNDYNTNYNNDYDTFCDWNRSVKKKSEKQSCNLS